MSDRVENEVLASKDTAAFSSAAADAYDPSERKSCRPSPPANDELNAAMNRGLNFGNIYESEIAAMGQKELPGGKGEQPPNDDVTGAIQGQKSKGGDGADTLAGHEGQGGTGNEGPWNDPEAIKGNEKKPAGNVGTEHPKAYGDKGNGGVGKEGPWGATNAFKGKNEGGKGTE